MKNFDRLSIQGKGCAFICLTLPFLLAAGTQTNRPANEADETAVEGAFESELEQEFNFYQELERALREEDTSTALVTEYVVIGFEPTDEFEHAGECPLKDDTDEEVQPNDIAVVIQGTCMGRVGDLIQLTWGFVKISVDVVGATAQIVDLEDTTALNPMIVVVPIGSE